MTEFATTLESGLDKVEWMCNDGRADTRSKTGDEFDEWLR